MWTHDVGDETEIAGLVIYARHFVACTLFALYTVGLTVGLAVFVSWLLFGDRP